MKIKISYQEKAEEQTIMKLLKPILLGAKVHRKDNDKPFKHTYIATRNSDTPTK